VFELSTTNKKGFIKKLAASAVMLSLATILSIFPTIQAPFGGSITVGSMVPVILITLIFGKKWGIITAVGYSFIQLMLGFSTVASWGLSLGVFIGSLMIDYILAYSVLGFAGIFGNKKLWQVIAGTALVCILRYLSHVLSGILFFGMWAEEGFNAYTWSIVYNGGYMLPETIITVIITVALYKLLPYIRKMYNIE
jgi:thiamine transporter